MKTTGIAYGFLLSNKDKSALEQALKNGRTAIETPTTLQIDLFSLQFPPRIGFSNGCFPNLVQLARDSGMNYGVVATLPETDSYSATERLKALFRHTLGDHDHGVFSETSKENAR